MNLIFVEIVLTQPNDEESTDLHQVMGASSTAGPKHDCKTCGKEVLGPQSIIQHKALCGVTGESTDEDERL